MGEAVGARMRIVVRTGIRRSLELSDGADDLDQPCGE
jgi:hypothetical protein